MAWPHKFFRPPVEVDPGIQELVPNFLSNRRKDVKKISEALARQDFKTIETMGHWMKGAGAGYGFQEISRIGRNLESAAQKSDEKQIQWLASELEQYLKNLRWKPGKANETAHQEGSANKPIQIIVFLVLGVSLFLTFNAWEYSKEAVMQRTRAKFRETTQHIQSGLQQRLALYMNALYGIDAFFAASNSVERDEWETFIRKNNFAQRFPAVQSLLYIEKLSGDKKDLFEKSVQADTSFLSEGYPGFRILPEGQRAEYFVIKYATTLRGNENLMGIDLGAEEELSAILHEGIDKAAPVMTGLMSFRKSTEASEILVLMPIYKKEASLGSIQERRAFFKGFAGIVFKPDVLLEKNISQRMIFKHVDVEVFDGRKKSHGGMIYDSGKEKLEGVERLGPDYLVRQETIRFAGRVWTIHFCAKVSLNSDRIRSYFPILVLTGGIIISFLLFGFLYVLSTSREKALKFAEKMTVDLRREIAERKKVELQLQEARDQAVEASHSKSDFLATVSHEIRTPMNAILGMAELLSENQPQEERLEYLKILKRSGEGLMQLINDILDLSKAEAGKIELEETDFIIRAKLSKLIELFIPLAREKDLDLSYEVSENVPAIVRADSARLWQVLLNLVTNAIKFTSKGSVSIHVKCDEAVEMDGKKKCRLFFSVRDTGIGIAPEKIEKIFQPFTQADSSTTRKYGGSGLGLSICKKLVEIMHGNIGVESTLGAGTTFYFSVEAGIPESQKLPVAASSSPENGEGKNGICDIQTPVKILLAEDFEDNRVLIQYYLKKTACRLEMAENGAAAFQKATLNRYDLILMDMHMPVMDGYKAVQAIRDWEKTAVSSEHRVFIIAVTADASKEARGKCLQAGCDSVLVKPIQKSVLLNEISKYLLMKAASIKERAA